MVESPPPVSQSLPALRRAAAEQVELLHQVLGQPVLAATMERLGRKVLTVGQAGAENCDLHQRAHLPMTALVLTNDLKSRALGVNRPSLATDLIRSERPVRYVPNGRSRQGA